ncbi:UNVERIFIED_CONTAM: putative transposon Ty5-1 protein [Sesamum radiatum]|uniref:Transposon Ty5-1 protein n=1 Tax=Sesamum radiatum TaxID=300843 RepID=A0AAW2UB87_SESRA
MAQRPADVTDQYERDVLFIHPSEHSNLTLTSSPLDDTNFIAWKRAVYVSVGTKMKHSFIDGTFPRPALGSIHFEQWRRVDLMVMQFLMGLHDSFNNEKSQILMLDPLPDIEKIFSMAYAVEKQRAGHTELEANSGHMAYQMTNITEIVAEVLKVMQRNTVATDPLISYAYYAQFDEEFAGNTVIPTGINENCWIIDTGATNHDQETKGTLVNGILHKKLYVYKQHYTLPDGSSNVLCLDTLILLLFVVVQLTPTTVLHWKTPYEILFGEEADIPSIPLPTVPLQLDYMLAPITQPTVQTEHVLVPNSSSNTAPQVTENNRHDPIPVRRSQRLLVDPGLVCKLERSIYGLKQASRQWNAELTLKLTEFGFRQSAHDHCLFTKGTSIGLMALLVYVDDILVTAPTLPLIQIVKDYLHSLSTIKDLGDARYFLDLEIARIIDGMYIAQMQYAHDIIQDTGLSTVKSTSTNFPLGLKLNEQCGALLGDPEWYRQLVGRLLYLGFTHLDISHAVKQLNSRGSLTGFCIFIGAALVSWKTKKQSTVSHSKVEVESRSMAATVCELRWISYILSDFGVSVKLPIQLFCDNQAALHIMTNPVFHERTKHIELDCHVVRDAYKDGFISPSHVRSSL